MQIHLHSDRHGDGSQAMVEHVEDALNGALGRFGERVSRVDVQLSESAAPARWVKGAIHCTLEAHVSGLEVLFVAAQATSAHGALEAGVRKLKRAVGASIARQDPRHHSARAARAAASTA